MYTGLWPVHFAVWWAAVAPVIPQEHGKNIPHRLILGSGWSVRADARTRPNQPQTPIRAGGAHSHCAEDLPSTEWFLENGFRPAQRNQDCHRLACRLVRNHWPNVDLVHSIMYDVWLKTEQLGDAFAWSEAMACINSAVRYVGPRVEEEIAWLRDLRWTPWL
jgi:hypothetical protein